MEVRGEQGVLEQIALRAAAADANEPLDLGGEEPDTRSQSPRAKAPNASATMGRTLPVGRRPSASALPQLGDALLEEVGVTRRGEGQGAVRIGEAEPDARERASGIGRHLFPVFQTRSSPASSLRHRSEAASQSVGMGGERAAPGRMLST